MTGCIIINGFSDPVSCSYLSRGVGISGPFRKLSRVHQEAPFILLYEDETYRYGDALGYHLHTGAKQT